MIEQRSGEHGEDSEDLSSEDKWLSGEATDLFLTCPLRTRDPRRLGLDVGDFYRIARTADVAGFSNAEREPSKVPV